MDAEKVAKLLDASKAIVVGNKLSTYKISEELAVEILRLIKLMTPENCLGYAIVNGERVVFRRGAETILAFVDCDRTVGAMRRLSENV